MEAKLSLKNSSKYLHLFITLLDFVVDTVSENIFGGVKLGFGDYILSEDNLKLQ